MQKMVSRIWLVLIILAMTALSCGLFSRTAETTGTGESVRNKIISQWASSASANSEYGNPDWAAHQATGAPDTLECGDEPTAWASLEKFTEEWLEVSYKTPVTPTEVNIYESHTPTQVVLIEIIDTNGNYHEVYTGKPEMAAECPYILSVPIAGADYKAMGVKITIDQSKLDLPWDEIDAVELVGYADTTVADEGQESDAVQEDQSANVPDSPQDGGPLIELPIANPDQEPSFSLTYSGCDDGQEQGTEIEVSVHDDRIDIRLWGTHGKYALLTLPRNLEDNFSDRLVPFALEGRVPSAAGLYIQSAWWFGEIGKVSTHYNDDGTLSGEVEFEGTRKNGCEFKVNAKFEHAVLRK